MDTETGLDVKEVIDPRDHDRTARQLRCVAAHGQTDARREWVRIATRC